MRPTMSTWKRLAVTGVTAVVALAACGSGDEGPGDEGRPALVGRTFLSTAVSVSGEDRALVPGTRITLVFGDDALQASVGCNSMSGPWTLEGTTLVLSEMAVTQIGCDPERHAQDEWLFGVLGARPAVSLAGDVLTLTGGDTVIELLDREVADPDRPLVGTEWRGDSIIEGGTVRTDPALPDVSLALAGDSTFRVRTGCNEGGGSVVLGGGTLTFAELALTKRACLDAAEVEAAVVAVLGAGQVEFEIEGPVLTLTAGRHGLVLRAS